MLRPHRSATFSARSRELRIVVSDRWLDRLDSQEPSTLDMIYPLENRSSDCGRVYYKVVARDNDLPAFDPVPMVKTVLLSPSSVLKIDRVVRKLHPLLGPFVFAALVSRFATFALPVHEARVLAPISAILHLPGIIGALADMRIEYVRIIVRTFDFCFLQGSNTLWAVVLSLEMNDVRILLVLVCWVNFTCWLLQETYLRNSYLIVGVALCEWVFYVTLLPTLSLELVDDLHHYTLLTARGRELSTQDVLANLIGNMAMLTLRNLYRRYQNVKNRKNHPEAAMQALGYRCKIALMSGPLVDSIVPYFTSHQSRRIGSARSLATTLNVSTDRHLPMQMHLASEPHAYDSCDTIWPRMGSLAAIASWQLVMLYGFGTVGGILAALSMFLPENTFGAEVSAVLSVVTSVLWTSVFSGCCQRQLLKRVVTSFHFQFLAAQMIATAFCVIDIFSRRWIPTCGVISSVLLAYTVLTVDALTPVMKRRLRFQYSIVVGGIILFWLVESALLLDVLVLGKWNLQDRVLLDFTLLGRRARFYVAPFMLSRVITIIVWSGRFVFVTLTRHDNNALILLRGNVEFDLERWKREAYSDPLRTI